MVVAVVSALVQDPPTEAQVCFCAWGNSVRVRVQVGARACLDDHERVQGEEDEPAYAQPEICKSACAQAAREAQPAV